MLYDYLRIGFIVSILSLIVWERKKSDVVSFIFFPLSTRNNEVGYGSFSNWAPIGIGHTWIGKAFYLVWASPFWPLKIIFNIVTIIDIALSP